VIYINTDGGIDKDRGYCAFVVKDEHENYTGSLSKIVSGTSNECEYHGLIFAVDSLYGQLSNLHHLLEGALLGISSIVFRSDSRLMVEQVMGRWKCKEPRLQKLLDKVQPTFAQRGFILEQIPRSRNKEADYLCNLCKVEGPKTEFASPIKRSTNGI
jgi:ribonuclease HI